MTKHTPGPWRVILAPTQIVTDEHVIANLYDVSSSLDKYANAHLIAAAPELLRMLIKAKDALANHPDGDLWQEIESTINKAKGK